MTENGLTSVNDASEAAYIHKNKNTKLNNITSNHNQRQVFKYTTWPSIALNRYHSKGLKLKRLIAHKPILETIIWPNCGCSVFSQWQGSTKSLLFWKILCKSVWVVDTRNGKDVVIFGKKKSIRDKVSRRHVYHANQFVKFCLQVLLTM